MRALTIRSQHQTKSKVSQNAQSLTMMKVFFLTILALLSAAAVGFQPKSFAPAATPFQRQSRSMNVLTLEKDCQSGFDLGFDYADPCKANPFGPILNSNDSICLANTTNVPQPPPFRPVTMDPKIGNASQSKWLNSTVDDYTKQLWKWTTNQVNDSAGAVRSYAKHLRNWTTNQVNDSAAAVSSCANHLRNWTTSRANDSTNAAASYANHFRNWTRNQVNITVNKTALVFSHTTNSVKGTLEYAVRKSLSFSKPTIDFFSQSKTVSSMSPAMDFSQSVLQQCVPASMPMQPKSTRAFTMTNALATTATAVSATAVFDLQDLGRFVVVSVLHFPVTMAGVSVQQAADAWDAFQLLRTHFHTQQGAYKYVNLSRATAERMLDWFTNTDFTGALVDAIQASFDNANQEWGQTNLLRQSTRVMAIDAYNHITATVHNAYLASTNTISVLYQTFVNQFHAVLAGLAQMYDIATDNYGQARVYIDHVRYNCMLTATTTATHVLQWNGWTRGRNRITSILTAVFAFILSVFTAFLACVFGTTEGNDQVIDLASDDGGDDNSYFSGGFGSFYGGSDNGSDDEEEYNNNSNTTTNASNNSNTTTNTTNNSNTTTNTTNDTTNNRTIAGHPTNHLGMRRHQAPPPPQVERLPAVVVPPPVAGAPPAAPGVPPPAYDPTDRVPAPPRAVALDIPEIPRSSRKRKTRNWDRECRILGPTCATKRRRSSVRRLTM